MQNNMGNNLKKTKLSTKIYFGFSAVIAIAIALGGIAIWNLLKIKVNADNLAKDYVPEVTVANNVERNSLHTMYANRGYVYTEEKQFLTAEKEALVKVKEEVAKALELGKSSSNLKGLLEAAQKADAGVHEYEKQFLQVEATINKLQGDRENLNNAAATYMKNINEYLTSQNKKMESEIGEGKKEKALVDRFSKVTAANDVIDYGNSVRLAVWKAQTLRSPKVLKDALPNFDKIAEKVDYLIRNSVDPSNIAQLNKVKEEGEKYKVAMLELLTNWEKLQLLAADQDKAGQAVLDEAKNTTIQGVEDAKRIAELAASVVSQSLWVLIIGLSIGAVFGIMVAFSITTNIASAMAKAITDLKSSSTQIMSATTQLSSAAQQLSSSSNEQASSVEETSSSLEELSGMVENNIGSAQQAFELSNKVKEKSESANATMDKLKESMTEILASNEKIEALVKVIDNIGEKTKVMDEIVFQTKLLSFNASVEAERAGEHGRGFAVVAQEVGNLAQMSGQAAQEIASIVKNSITEASTITTENKKKVDGGNEYVKQTAESLQEIMRSAQTVANGANQVLNASKDQSKGIKQINTAMGQVDKATQENASTAEETASSSEELAAQVETLNRVVQDLVILVDGVGDDQGGQLSYTKTNKAHHAPAAQSKPNVLKFQKKTDTSHGENSGEDKTIASSEVKTSLGATGTGDDWEKL